MTTSEPIGHATATPPHAGTPPLAEPTAWHEISCTVNGQPVTMQVESRLLLSDLLRHRLSLTGTHVGCEQGSCGACTVLLDGVAVRSCLTLAAACDGREITTVENLAVDESTLHPIQQQFHENHAMQCGFCTSGFLMSVAELQRRGEDVTDDAMLDQLGGNICRCTGYTGIRKAARKSLGIADTTDGDTAHHADDTAAGGCYLGRPMARREDDRLLRGKGRFVDDLALPGTLDVAFYRSPVAHARITGVDVTAARAMPGVVAVYTAADIDGRVEPLLNTEELRIPPGLQEALHPLVCSQPMEPLAAEEVNFVGQPVVMVVAESRYLAEDAVAEVVIDFEQLPVVLDPEAALVEGSPKALLTAEDNVGIRVKAVVGDVDAAFEQAAAVVSETFTSQRYVASPLETRGLLARMDSFSGRLEVWTNTQTPHRTRDHVAEAIGLSPDNVHLTAVDTGGGFGQKGVLVVEELLIPFAAYDLGRPVRWIEDRSENLISGTHAREQIHHISLAADADGRLLAIRDRFIVNLGCRTFVGLVIPYNSIAHITGGYRVPAMELEAIGALTNTTYTTPYRGAGRPEAVLAMERAMGRLAHELGITPDELRMRNLLTPADMPYRNGLLDRRGLPHEIDSGDYPEMMRLAREMVDLPAFRKRQKELRAQGRNIGVGFAFYTEMTGLGPFESARVSVRNSGRILVATGAPSQGQGHATSFAQIAADALGVPVDLIDVVGGDTDTVPHGIGTIASRALVTAGNATHEAATALRGEILAAAARAFGTDPAHVSLDGGDVVSPDGTRIGLRQLLRQSAFLPDGNGRSALSATSYFQPPNYATSSGLHVAVVEVDPAVGSTKFLDYVVVHEAGTIVNPLIADGQIIGGTAQGIGGALYEHMIYDDTGQPVTTTYMDYLLPTVESIPDIRLAEVNCPSPTNTLGVKGLGEGGAVGPPAAVAGAVEDALAPFGVIVRTCPLTPNAVRALVRSAQTAPAQPTPQESGESLADQS